MKSNSFFISDSLNYENYISGGICEEIKQSFIKNYYNLKERYYNPYLEKKPFPFDFLKQRRNELILCRIIALHECYENHNNSLPELNNPEISKEIFWIAEDIYNKAKKKSEKWVANLKTWKDKVVSNIAIWGKSEISPICSFLGGILAQEIIKYIGKYTPIDQWFCF